MPQCFCCIAELSSHRQLLASVSEEKDSLGSQLRESKAETSRLRVDVQEANKKVGQQSLSQECPRQETRDKEGLRI